jgi:hypothetical protein
VTAVPARAPVPPKSNALRYVLIGAGCLIPLVIAFLLLVWAVTSFFSRSSTTAQNQPQSRLQAAITSALQSELSENKQKLYDKIHVAGLVSQLIQVGTAKSDVIQAVSLEWKDGRMTDNPSDLLSFTVDHTLYWKTPVTSDGHTKFRDKYDFSGGTPRLADTKVLETNGATIENVFNAVMDYAGKEIVKSLDKAIRDAANPSPSPAP